MLALLDLRLSSSDWIHKFELQFELTIEFANIKSNCRKKTFPLIWMDQLLEYRPFERQRFENKKTELESLKALKLELMQNDFDWCNIGSQRKSRIQLELSGWKKMDGWKKFWPNQLESDKNN